MIMESRFSRNTSFASFMLADVGVQALLTVMYLVLVNGKGTFISRWKIRQEVEELGLNGKVGTWSEAVALEQPHPLGR